MDAKSRERYRLYSLSVQCPDQEIDVIEKCYQSIHGRKPRVLREDFCGSFLNSVTWIKRHRDNVAIGIDLDPEPIAYGQETYLSKLTAEQQKRFKLLQANVLTAKAPPAEVICAFNFSYFCLQRRADLLKYFKQCRSQLKKDGILLLDCFGGQASVEPHVEEVDFPHHGFRYYWELRDYDYVNSRALYSIHFKPKRGLKMNNAFVYDWRIWSIPEIRDLLAEAGFSESLVLTEGTTRNGEGNGKFRPTPMSTEICETWVVYIVGLK